MPAPIVLANLTPETKIVPNPPVGEPIIATRADLRDGTRSNSNSGGGGGSTPAQGLIFSDNFDNQPEWSGSQDLAATGVTGWFKSRNGELTHNGDAIYITSAIPGAIMNGAQKALVAWRRSYMYDEGNPGNAGPANNWYNDGMLTYYTGPGEGVTEIFVRFKLKFDPNWTHASQTKMFRIKSWDEGDPDRLYAFFSQGDSCPGFLWSWHSNDYGVRNTVSFRMDPQETNYFPRVGTDIQNLPRGMVDGDMSLNFNRNMTDPTGTGSPIIPVTMIDKTTGQTLIPQDILSHDQIFGDTENVMEFYLKMNSAPGVLDGVAKQWINGQLCMLNETVAWMTADSPGNRKWNVVSFGGNARFFEYPNAQAVEEWVSYGDIEIYNYLPENMQ